MNYTESNGFAVHTGTGQRMHRESQAVPTAIGDKDLNQLIWSLMEVVKAAGLSGVEFDPDVPTSYTRLLQSIQLLNSQASSDLPGRLAFFMQPTAPAGWIKPNGVLLSRTVYPNLWAHVESVGAVSEVDWASGKSAWFSSGDGSTTFRMPDFRSAFLRPWDDGRGVDAGRQIGTIQQSANLSHVHPVADPTHMHPVGDPAHGHPLKDPTHGHAGELPSKPNGAGGGPIAMQDGSNPITGTFSYATNSSATGISVQTATTGISIVGASTGISIQASGGAEAHPFNAAVPLYMKY